MVNLGGVKNDKPTLPFMNFFQFLLHISEFSAAKSFITSFINNSETDFLEENLENCSVENQYFLGYFEGKRDEFKDMLERFLLISSTCFVKKALHSKELNHKRFSKNDWQFLLFLADFFALINSVWALQRLDLWPQFC